MAAVDIQDSVASCRRKSNPNNYELEVVPRDINSAGIISFE